MIDLRHGDMLDVLPTLDADSIEAAVTDPPYGLDHRQRRWHGGDLPLFAT